MVVLGHVYIPQQSNHKFYYNMQESLMLNAYSSIDFDPDKLPCRNLYDQYSKKMLSGSLYMNSIHCSLEYFSAIYTSNSHSTHVKDQTKVRLNLKPRFCSVLPSLFSLLCKLCLKLMPFVRPVHPICSLRLCF